MHQFLLRFTIVLSCLLPCTLWANISGVFVPNQGQWPADVLYKTSMAGSDIWFTKEGIRYSNYSVRDLNQIHEHDCKRDEHSFGKGYSHLHKEDKISGHVYQMDWPADAAPLIQPSDKDKAYFNFIKGRDKNKWASNVPGYKHLKVTFDNSPFYYEFLFDKGRLKYNIWLDNPQNIDQFTHQYKGLNEVSLQDNKLVLNHSFDKVSEEIPEAYQIINDDTVVVQCKFKLDGNNVGFEFLSKINPAYPVCIDPIVVASTFTGASVINLGHSATYDQAGNVYGAGRPIGVGFPVTLGAYKYDYSGLVCDVGLVKFNQDGSSIVWATYLGGNKGDYVHSIIVNSKREIVLYGKTFSSDYPVLENSYDTSYHQGADVFVSVLSGEGMSLNGSTLFGGSGDDGQNVVFVDSHSGFKGEVNVDDEDNIYIATSSSSLDLTLTGGFDTINNGNQDGVLLKYNNDLSEMIWGNYLGGNDEDVLLGVKVHPNGNVYTCGITESYNYPAMATSYQQNYGGGTSEGVISCISADGDQLLYSTFYGGVYRDKLLFLDIDKSGDVYCLGESDTETTSPGKYQGPSNASPSSHGGLVVKFDKELQTKMWASVFHKMNFTAFMVDDCYRIYTSGYEPSMNLVDVTPNAFISTNQGFYLMVLQPDATGIHFGSFWGGVTSHVDGGTSRFDKRGVITQATCTFMSFPLTANAYSDNINGGYDMSVFKIDMETDLAAAFAAPVQYPHGCIPFTLNMTNDGSQGATGHWFVDQQPLGSADSIVHTFDSVGTYEVMYIIEDSSTCNVYDTATFLVEAELAPSYSYQFDTADCHESIAIELIGNINDFTWADGSDSNLVWINTDTTFWITLDNQCGIIVDSFEIDVLEPVSFDLGGDTAICDSLVLTLPNSPDYTYSWFPHASGNSITVHQSGNYIAKIDNGICSYEDTIQVVKQEFYLGIEDTVSCQDSVLLSVDPNSSIYKGIRWSNGSLLPSTVVYQSGLYVAVANFGDCSIKDSVQVDLEPIDIEIVADSILCEPKEFTTQTIGNGTVTWFDGTVGNSIMVNQSGWVWATTEKDVCSKTDSVFVTKLEYLLEDTVRFCEGESVILHVEQDYPATLTWSNGYVGNNLLVSSSGYYSVNIHNSFCKTAKEVIVEEIPLPYFELGEDIEKCYGIPEWIGTDVEADQYQWSTGDSSAFIHTSNAIGYTLKVTKDGCSYEDHIELTNKIDHADYLFFNPNIITPNNDGYNDRLRFLKADVSEIGAYNLTIYNRWGALVFETDDPLEYWLGSNEENSALREGVYFFVIQYKIACENAEYKELKGTISLLK